MTDPANWNWNSGPRSPGPAVVVDIDGVLADAAGRQHFLAGEDRDWQGFFDASGDDPVIEEVRVLLEHLDHALAVVLLTARPERIHAVTEAWLRRTGIRWDLLIMHPPGAGTSRDFKAEAVVALRERGFDLRLAFEDDRRNVEMFREAGVPCVYIHSGYYD